MSVWPSNTPRRIGVDTLRRLAQRTCILLATFTPIIKTYLPEDRHVYVDALNQACSDFINNVPDNFVN